jgi:hypothetical protein
MIKSQSTRSSFQNLFLTSVFLLALWFPAQAQEPQAKQQFAVVCIGYYNVENLFDTILSPERIDLEWTPQGTNQWNTERYNRKLENISKVIGLMGQDITPSGPAVMGVSEVENKQVLIDLANHPNIRNRDYQVVHYESPDRRGIDVAFMYQPRYFTYLSSKPYRTWIEGRDDFVTRDQLLVTGELLGERMHFIVVHWPSRLGGERRSRPLRIAAANIARHIIDSIQLAEPGARVMIMGDFNDDPSDRSVSRYLRAHDDQEKMTGTDLFNPFLNFYRRGIGTLAYRDAWNLFDMVILNPPLVSEEPGRLRFFRAEVFNRPFLRQSSGRFQGYGFRTFAGGVYLGGFSDHFPVYVFLIRPIE